MADQHPPTDAADADQPADGRDERLAGLLAVEPLDELTRRRLVSTALPSSAPARRARTLVAAAALVLVVVAGAGVVVALRGSGTDQVAAERRSELDTSALDAAGSARAPAAAEAAGGPASVASPVELGDFGELSQPANRDRARAATTTPAAGAAPKSQSARKLANLDCVVRDLPAGVVVGVGTGTLDATDVIVVVTETPGGTRVVSTVDRGTCRVRPLS